jgi:hypothetical protein
MKTLAFVGHSHHAITKSSHFFKRHLDANYIVHDFAIDPSDSWQANLERLSGIADGNFDGVVLWQIDYLASFFLRRGIPVIVCPMYDSSSILKPTHWTALREALIICFSLELQWLIAKAGVESVYVKYFPGLQAAANHDDHPMTTLLAAERFSSKAKNAPLKAFFWERLPDTSLSSQQVISLLSDLEIEHLHIHQAADPGRISNNIEPDSAKFLITTSSWFDSSEEYQKLLASADLFIAPRFSEGIGMSFLEAMGYGCCVVAHDMATHNEYIRNWDNGILVDFSSTITPLVARPSDIRIIGEKARRDSQRMRENWESFYLRQMLESMDEYLSTWSHRQTLKASKSWQIQDHEQELQHLFAAHNNWKKYYGWLDKLHASESSLPPATDQEGILPAVASLEREGNYQASLALLDAAIQKQANTSVYDLFRQQLLERMSLKQF